MTDKKEKVVNLDDLSSEDTTSFLDPTPKESKTIDLKELEEEKNVPKVTPNFINPKKVKSKPLSEEELKRRKNWLMKKVEIGPKRLNKMFFAKGGAPLFMAYSFFALRLKLLSENFGTNELKEFIFRMTSEPLMNFLYFGTIVLVMIAIYFFSMEPLQIFEDTAFTLSADGIDGVDSVVPITTILGRRRMRWEEIEKVKVNEFAKIPHVALINKGKVIMELPLFISNQEDLEHGIKEFCPEDCPLRLIINKFKKS